MNHSAKFLEAMQAYDDSRAETAAKLMEECASHDDPAACFTLAIWYKDGDGVAADQGISDRWLARHLELAELGNIEAQWNAGQNYRFGNLLPLNVELANYWLERAASAGHGEAQHHLAWYYETGQYNYTVDLDEANKWYQLAFEQEHPETLYMYATRLFSDGNITDEAIILLRKAANKGLKQAKYVLDANMH
jgi:uncharacterized protein